MRLWSGAVLIAAALFLAACTHTVKVEPIEVKPIQITVDVNLKVQKELDEFFDFEEKYEEPAGAADAGGAQ